MWIVWIIVGIVLAAAGWIAASKRRIPHALPLPHAVSGERRDLASTAGRLSYYCSGTGTNARPLLLIHSINAAGSAYEVRPLYEHYGRERPVYALELPGFGFSERGERDYHPRLMTDAVLAMADEIARHHGAGTVDALGLSLSSEFLARAAAEHPQSFRTIALVSPTGFDRRTPDTAEPGSTRAMPAFRRILSVPLWNRAFFDLLTSKPSIRFFLQKTWGSKRIDEGMVQYDYLTAHQPAAQYAPYSFVSGFLFSRDIRQVYRSLPHPVFMAHGTRGDFVDYSASAGFKNLPNWHFHVMQTGALPHFEDLPGFVRGYDAFLEATAPSSREAASAVQ
jgi:pimeloyl-ACP methyl ester carboxylesterase